MKIRTVKPEFWQSEKLATRISRDARLLFIGLLCMADDHGRFRAHPNLIRGEVFPYEEDAPVEEWIRELVGLGIVRLYQHGGSQYGVVSNFAEHQKIDKRWASRLPPPPADDTPSPPPKREEAPQVHAEQVERHAEQSASLADRTPTDRIGSDRKGTEPLQTRAQAREGSAAPEPQKPRSPEPRRGPRLAPPPSPEVAALQQALLATPFRSETKPKDREFVVLAFAVEVFPTGLRAEHVPRLLELDEGCPNRKGPVGSLFATWMKRNMWREVLDEDANRAKEARAASGVVRGADPYAVETPKAAASVIGDVLARAKAGG